MSYCPYCSLGVSNSAGAVFCSRHMTDFDRLDNGIFLIKGNDIYSEPHYSRFALRFMISGRMEFTIDNKKYFINGPGVLLFGQHSHYTLEVPPQWKPSAHIGIAFKPSFLKSAAMTLNHDSHSLLGLPEMQAEMPLADLRHWPLLQKASFLRDKLLVHSLKNNSSMADDVATEVLQWYMEEYSRYKSLMPAFNNAVRTSTRDELIRRADMAREIITYSDVAQLTVSEVAKLSGFSEFHFIRTYKQIFGVSPYKHIVIKRLQKAHTLLSISSKPVSDIALSVGYNDHAAFSRAFRNFYGYTPSALRKDK